MNIKLNNVDFSGYFNIYGIKPGLEKVEGPHSGVAQDGTSIIDLVDVKDTFELEGNGLTQEQFTALTNLCRLPYVTAVYDSSFTGQSVTKVVILTLGGSHQVPMRGKMYYDEVQITMREK